MRLGDGLCTEEERKGKGLEPQKPWVSSSVLWNHSCVALSAVTKMEDDQEGFSNPGSRYRRSRQTPSPSVALSLAARFYDLITSRFLLDPQDPLT